MAPVTLDEAQVKELVKQALVEVLQERRDLLRDVVAEVVEDLGLMRAIREGESTGAVGRDEVLRTLEGTS